MLSGLPLADQGSAPAGGQHGHPAAEDAGARASAQCEY